jgi:hypothetical protein
MAGAVQRRCHEAALWPGSAHPNLPAATPHTRCPPCLAGGHTCLLQTAAGTYDESGLEALDYVLDSAARHNISLILSFIDNWKYYNGVDQVLGA